VSNLNFEYIQLSDPLKLDSKKGVLVTVSNKFIIFDRTENGNFNPIPRIFDTRETAIHFAAQHNFEMKQLGMENKSKYYVIFSSEVSTS
jgi:hypothetical protein